LKFGKYDKQTGHVKEELYAVAAVLDPHLQMNSYNPEHWEREEQIAYQATIIQFYKKHYMKYEQSAQPQISQASGVEVTILGNRLGIAC